MNNNIRLYLDNIVFSLQKAGGVSVVWYELLRRIILDPHVSELKLLEYADAVTNIFRNKLGLSENLILPQRNSVSFMRYINPTIRFEENTIFHSSYYRTCSDRMALNVTTVHDFTYEKYTKGVRQKLHSWQKNRAIRSSDLIICISKNTKKDLLTYLPDVDSSKIRVVYNGVSNDYFPLKVQDAQLPFLEKSFVLFVGGRQDYKNFELALEAVSDSSMNFVIVGQKLSSYEVALLEKKIPGRYKLLTKVSNEILNRLYNGAFCLLYPSSYEGFGIPVLEAQKAACPVIAYSASSIPEIIGSDTLLINELNKTLVLDRFRLLMNSNFRDQVVENGLNNSSRFSWDNTYAETMKVYEELLYSKK